MNHYTASEMMVVAAARALAGEHTVFVGVGLPNIACNLARRTVAPDLELIYESGVFGARPARLPLSIGDPTLVSGAKLVCTMADLFMLYLQGGRVDVALLGAAQIDRFGNINTTVIGDYDRPKVRLPGSGGACEIVLLASKTFIIMRQSLRGFVEKIDFLTSPGHLTGGAARMALKMPGQGPVRVISDMAVFKFDEKTKEMTLASVHPTTTIETIQENVGWDLRVAGDVHVTPEPTSEELCLIREELDPGGIYTT